MNLDSDNILQKNNLIENFDTNKYLGLSKFKKIWNAEDAIKNNISKDVINLWNKLLEINGEVETFLFTIKNNITWNKTQDFLIENRDNYAFNNILRDSEDSKSHYNDEWQNLHLEFREHWKFFDFYKYINFFNDVEQININDFMKFLKKIIFYIETLSREYKTPIRNESKIIKDKSALVCEISLEIDQIKIFINDYENEQIIHDAKNNKEFNLKINELKIQTNEFEKIKRELNELEGRIMRYKVIVSHCDEIINGDDNLNSLIKQIKEKNDFIEHEVKKIRNDNNMSYVFQKLVEDKNLFNNNADKYNVRHYDIESRIKEIINEIYIYSS